MSREIQQLRIALYFAMPILSDADISAALSHVHTFGLTNRCLEIMNENRAVFRDYKTVRGVIKNHVQECAAPKIENPHAAVRKFIETENRIEKIREAGATEQEIAFIKTIQETFQGRFAA